MRTSLLAPTLEDACRRWSERPALTHQGHTVSYGELWERVLALAAAYRRLGIAPGDRVVCQLPDNPEHIVAIHAAWAVGAVHVGADNDLTAPELASLVSRLEARALLFQPRSDAPDPLAPPRAVRDARPEMVVIVHQAAAEEGGWETLEALIRPPNRSIRPSTPAELGVEEPAVLFLTSGTTGRPKAAIDSYPALWAKLQFFADAYAPSPDDVHLMFLPVSHAFGFKLALTALLSGGQLVLLDRFSPDGALHLITDEQVSILPGTPTHFTLLLEALDPSRHDVSTLRWAVAAAAPLRPDLLERIYGELGVELFFVYGCSEGFLTVTTDRDEIFRGTVGKMVFAGPEGTPPTGAVTIVGPEEAVPLPPGDVGEIAFGASRPVRYWGDPEAAADGWYRTGDLGRIDGDGCVVVLGRLKELINRGGLKVAPAEVEAALQHHPDLVDAGVVATEDPVLGEAICACVVPRGPDAPSLSELRSYLASSLARHKLPDELCVVTAVPRTRISKVDRPALRHLVDGGPPPERLRPR
jgi:acyl-CoA synthetase (AMP-forming)/AMP-acid ligase II